jgi:predicted nucleic acid-binding protein
MQVVMDASAIMSVLVEEPGRKIVENLAAYADLLSPEVMPFEIGNGLTKMMKRNLVSEKEMQSVFDYYTTIPIGLRKIQMKRALDIAWKYKIYAYDAYYLEIASRLNLPLLTFDDNMKRTAKDMGIFVLEE